MANKVKLKRSYTAGAVPLTTDLDTNECAVNWADSKLFTKDAAGNIVSVTLGGGGGGSGSIVTAATVSAFPATGSSSGTLYLATDTARAYIWAGVYVEVGVSGGGTDTELRALFTPAAPTSVTATAGNAQAVVSWTAPSVLAQTPITDYTVQFSTNSGSTWTTFTDAVSATASATVTGLTNGTAVIFRIAAVNGIGTGSYSSASSAVTPAAAAAISYANKFVPAGMTASTHSVSGSSTITASLTGGEEQGDTRLWLLIGQTGTLSYTVTASSEGADGGRLYLTSSSPSMHVGVAQYNPATTSGLTNVSAAVSGTATSTGTASVTAGQYLVLRYYKDSSYPQLNDRITAVLSIA